ncbi:MAG TPA: hypothetical protein VFR64_20400 [Methylomirabilota bacterium]|nr:hypothetical protein [Methylomirabilota bacterium]
MRRAATPSLILAGILSTGCGMTLAQESEPAAAVGRVEMVDVKDSVVVAEFPEGTRLIHVDTRQAARYRPGDEIRLDRAGRPLPPRPY